MWIMSKFYELSESDKSQLNKFAESRAKGFARESSTYDEYYFNISGSQEGSKKFATVTFSTAKRKDSNKIEWLSYPIKDSYELVYDPREGSRWQAHFLAGDWFFFIEV